MALKLTNNPISTLAAAITTAATSLSVAAADANKFPALAAGDWFPATIVDSGGNMEIVRVTARNSATLTITRAQEGTTARAFAAGARIDVRLTAAAINEIYNAASAAVSLTGDSSKNGRLSVGGQAASLASGTFNAQLKVLNQDGGATSSSNVAAVGLDCQGQYAASLALRADGVMGFGGGSANGWRTYVDLPTGNFTTAGDISAYSDPRLKQDIEPISGALEILRQLDGVYFTWNRVSNLIGRPGERDMGLLADQVHRVLPLAGAFSMKDPDNNDEQWLMVAYSKLIPVLLEAVKDLDRQVKELQGRAA
jgi:hypothetical protein